MSLSRLLVVMPNWFGETLFVTPLLRALREARPELAVTAMGVPRCGEVLDGNPHLRRFLVYDETGRQRGWAAKWRFARQLRAERFDAAIILRRSMSRTAVLAVAGIPRGIGFANPKSGWLLTDPVPTPTTGHKAHRYLALLRPLGLEAATTGPCEYYPSDAERAWAQAWLQRHGLGVDRPLAVLHPGGNWPHKRWPPARFAELANRLAQRGAAVLITGSPADGPLVVELAKGLTVPVTTLVGDGTIRELAAILERAQLVVTNDTGPAHVAAALRRPLVALFGPTDPAYTGPLGHPPLTRILHRPDGCPRVPCLSPDRPPHAGMSAIPVDDVFAACQSLLTQPVKT